MSGVVGGRAAVLQACHPGGRGPGPCGSTDACSSGRVEGELDAGGRRGSRLLRSAGVPPSPEALGLRVCAAERMPLTQATGHLNDVPQRQARSARHGAARPCARRLTPRRRTSKGPAGSPPRGPAPRPRGSIFSLSACMCTRMCARTRRHGCTCMSDTGSGKALVWGEQLRDGWAPCSGTWGTALATASQAPPAAPGSQLASAGLPGASCKTPRRAALP